MASIEERIKKLEQILEDRLPSKTEIEKIREVIERYGHSKWLWSSLKVWILLALSGIALLTTGLDGLKEILKRLMA
jgi:hypothetical protein